MLPIDEELFGEKPRRKASINSRVKGSKNEVALSKLLSEWTSMEFHRVPMSGGLRWKDAQNICGDLICTSGEFPFTIETKHYKKVGVTDPLRSNSIIYRFFAQAERDAERGNKIPLLFVRENSMPKNEYYVFFNITDLTKVVCEYHIPIISEGRGIWGIMASELFQVDYKNVLKLK
jgi:hypothetical protein